jgi:hypothetical protein
MNDSDEENEQHEHGQFYFLYFYKHPTGTVVPRTQMLHF